MPQTYDAVVIGAGVMGTRISFHLAERELNVAILERKVTASGATDTHFAIQSRDV